MLSSKLNNGLLGIPLIPGDKSISHRSIIIPSISQGITEVKSILKSEDVRNTINAFKLMGVQIIENKDSTIIFGKGLNSLKEPKEEIYLGNSGTSARLLTGLLSCQKFDSKITGDKSLSSRPMGRIIDPLLKMKAKIISKNNCLPLSIYGSELTNSNIRIDIPSAQIKSGILLAALNTAGKTNITEKHITRDHTETMLEAFGADIDIKNINYEKIITIDGKKELKSKNIDVPSDLSSGSFFIVAALINKGSRLKLENININPSRNGIIIALQKMGAKISFLNKRYINNEQVSDIEVEYSKLSGCDLDGDFAKLMIDEFPILAVAASFANSPSIFKGLQELRVKESDRLNLIALNLKKCGVQTKIVKDDLHIYPSKELKIEDPNIRTDFDHRIAMSFAVMGSRIGPLNIKESNSIDTSFPSFIREFNKIGGQIS
tara:strand:+ start:5262 stop:6560 length:1299 start_codon:yes stop_codon:yes gene_type:complete